MELKQVRDIITQSPKIDDLNNFELNLTFNVGNYNLSLKGIYNIYKFFRDESGNWDNLKSEIGSNFNDSVVYFKNGLRNFESFLNNNVLSDNYQGYEISTFLKRNYQASLQPNQFVFIAEFPEVRFLIELEKRNRDSFLAAFNYLTNQSLSVSTKNALEGYLNAYEFQNQTNSHIFKRREQEKKSFNKLRNDFQNLVNNCENEVIEKLKDTEENYQEHLKALTKYQKNSEDSMNQWMISHKGDFENFCVKSEEKVKSLEKQYAELLKLQEPVKYWKDKAKDLKSSANKLMIWLGSISIAFALGIYSLLWLTPADLMESIFTGDKGRAIRWSIIFVIFISIYFIIAKSLMKYIFSNLHLARDAEEREKLTYLYISLINQSEFSEDERKIVMQALFSRSDTGLLKEDSSPTMPGIGGIIEKIK
ncbi:DUF6161 domain-containing protein [Sphingobacterium puteale]|uniref:DUF6161 domain-containing protein n=1 Tax=Sphingobacterium puteale TaxID=2420510 RepID=UPI003D952A4D